MKLWATVGAYAHYRCRACRHLFVHPKPSQASLDAYYGDGAFYDLAERQEVRLRKEAAQRVALLSSICTQLALPTRALDVGCASGYFLAAAQAAGWDARGVERSDKIAQRARMRFGVTVHVGVFEKLTIPGAPFPVITAWEVLEHAVDPVGFFRSIASHMMPGGLLAISTPLADGIPARVMGHRFPMIAPPEHLSLFSRASLNIMAGRDNLRELHFSTFSNLNTRALSSGLSRLLFDKDVDSIGGAMRGLLGAAGFGMAWLPGIVDWLGMGSEMLVVFRSVHT